PLAHSRLVTHRFSPCRIAPLSSSSFPTRRSSDLVTELMLTLESAIDSFDFKPRNILDLISEYFHFDNVDMDEYDEDVQVDGVAEDRKSTRLNSSHVSISYAVFCLKKKSGRVL